MRTKIRKENIILYPELSYEINGILFQVRKDLGIFLNEKQYCDKIEDLLKERGMHYEREKFLQPSFAGEQENRNKVDFLIENKIILEIKAKGILTKEDYYQTQRYLESSEIKLAILVNMRRYSVTPKRILKAENFKQKIS